MRATTTKDMHRRALRAMTLAAGLSLVTLASGCGSLGSEVESLEPSKWEADEGVVVARIFTARTEEDSGDAECDPDLDYSLRVGSSKSLFLQDFTQKGQIHVEGKEGPTLVVRSLPGGDYYFNELAISGGTAPMAVKFTVQPGRVTYVGDLHVLFIESKGFLGLGSQTSCAYRVESDPAAVLEALRKRFTELPEVALSPMVVESLSL